MPRKSPTLFTSTSIRPWARSAVWVSEATWALSCRATAGQGGAFAVGDRLDGLVGALRVALGDDHLCAVGGEGSEMLLPIPPPPPVTMATLFSQQNG